MLILGLVLLLAAAALTAGMLLGNTSAADITLFGEKVTAFSVGELFAIGVATGIVAGLSLAMALSGLRRSGRKRRERRAELKTKRAREQELQEENARLARELDQQRRAGAPAGRPGSGPRGAGPTAGGPGSPPAGNAGRPQGNRSDAPDGPDRTQPLTPGAGRGSYPPPDSGSHSAGTGFERPSAPPSQPPTSAPEPTQEGRRPLS